MFNFLKEKLTKAYEAVTQKLSTLFTRPVVDEEWLTQLKRILLAADTGSTTTTRIVDQMRAAMQAQQLSGEQAHKTLTAILNNILVDTPPTPDPKVLLLVGVNGSGKTTFLGKLAHRLVSNGKKVLVVAGDTFRAAAADQLSVWAERTGADVHVGRDGQYRLKGRHDGKERFIDPASLVFDACVRFKSEQYDHLLIDTAGRLQTKINLMNELEKIHRIVQRQLPDDTMHTWLTLDSMLGQNNLAQAQQFHEATNLNGLVLTKCDGTGKAGFLFAISSQLQLPIQYITYGEQLSALKAFDRTRYITELLDA